MKKIQFFALAALFATAAQATSLHPDTFRNEVAPAIVSADITEVGTVGEVLKVQQNHPFTTFLIAIPAKVGTGSACSNFVGIQTDKAKPVGKSTDVLRALAVTDPTIDACIEIFPMPVETKLTVEMKVLTGGFVAANNIQTQHIQIEGQGMFFITLDMGNESVKIQKVFTKH